VHVPAARVVYAPLPMSQPKKDGAAPPPGTPAKKKRTDILFLVKFLALLTFFFLAVAPKPVNDAIVEPFTAGVAKVGGRAVRIFGEPTDMIGTIIQSPRFSVNIRNGCNGLETIFIFAAAVLAFPAPWKVRGWGLLLGFLAIQAVNIFRIVSLFYIGIHWPKLFEQSHQVIWQAIVILFGVVLWIIWADRFALPPRPGREKAAR
jgi:exosortase H (IPTLxxWG-CTERM-specific)